MPEAAVPTVGDPAAMRELAKELMGRAELIGTAPSGATTTLGEATFEGPAADRLRGSVGEARTQVTDAASRLREIAARLLADATTVEQRNAELKSLAEEKARLKAEAEADKLREQGNGASGGSGSGTSPTTDVAADPDLVDPTGGGEA